MKTEVFLGHHLAQVDNATVAPHCGDKFKLFAAIHAQRLRGRAKGQRIVSNALSRKPHASSRIPTLASPNHKCLFSLQIRLIDASYNVHLTI